MDDSYMKCVMVIDSELPIGVIANTSAILGVTFALLCYKGYQRLRIVKLSIVDQIKKTHYG